MAVEGDIKKYSTIAQGYLDDSPLTFDELVDENGNVRAHWRDFMKAQEKLGAKEIQMRKKELERVLDENGVTFNAYTENSSQNRPWDLDPCPLIIDGAEWDSLDEGLVQRAQLFDAMYKDEKAMITMIQAGTAMAAMVAFLGLFGITGYTAKRRMKEMGIRKVLGATFNNIQFILNKSSFIKLGILTLM